MDNDMAHLLRTHHGGWRPQKPDHRDLVFVPPIHPQSAPGAMCLHPGGAKSLGLAPIPRINQGQQGSCTGHGTSGVVMCEQRKQGQMVVVPSREFIYYNARVYEGTPGQDSGAEVRDAVKVVVRLGVPPDSDFPYDDHVFDRKPPPKAYADAVRQEALVYKAVRYPYINATIASGYVIVFGFTAYESLEGDAVARTGRLPVPAKGEPVVGGHSVWVWGFNARVTDWTCPACEKVIPARTKACRNSWQNADGTWWGDGGDFYIPQFYWDHGLATDHWIIERLGSR